MPAKKKRAGPSHAKRKGSSRVLYFSLGAAAAAVTAALVTLRLRRNLTARASHSGRDFAEEGETQSTPAPSLAAEVAPTESAGHRRRMSR
jgi:type 1 glutamine amidotransferase